MTNDHERIVIALQSEGQRLVAKAFMPPRFKLWVWPKRDGFRLNLGPIFIAAGRVHRPQ